MKTPYLTKPIHRSPFRRALLLIGPAVVIIAALTAVPARATPASGVTSVTIANGTFADIDVYAKHEGLALATVLTALLPACALTAMAAIVCWSHATGRVRDPQTIPLLVVTVVGAILVVLYTTDSVSRLDFGTMLPEDAAFLAVAAMILWLVGAFWIARMRRVGAILIGLGTLIVLYSFITLHVLAGTSVSAIASKSGPVWAGIALAMATLAAGSFVTALALVVEPLLRRQSGKRPPSGP